MPIDSIKWQGKTPANSRGRELDFTDYIQFELTNAKGVHDTLVTQFIRWLELYRAPVKQPERNIPYEGAPLSRDSEILTKSGWRRIDAIAIGELVLTRRDDTGEMEWKPVQALPKTYAEKLYHFKSRSMDLQVTAQHTMIAERQEKRGIVRRIKAGELWEKTGFVLPQHGVWKGKNPTKLWGLPAGDVAEFIGWYLSEGSVAYQSVGPRGRHCVRISQSRTANPEKCRRIEDLLTRLKFNWQYFGHDFVVYAGSIPTALFDLLAGQRKSYKKRVPQECFEWSPVLIDRLLMGMIEGDGCITDLPNANYPKVDYYTSSKGMADDVQVLALFCGLHARVLKAATVGALGGVLEDGRQIVAKHDQYVVSICASSYAKYDRAKHAVVEYNDVAFCVTVENHAIYARRHGKASWTGNSNFMLPTIASDADPLYAKFIQSLHATDNLWTTQALNERWVKAAKPLQDMLTWLDHSLLKMYDVNKRVVSEMVKLGTGIYKTGWTYERRPIWTYNEQGIRVKAIKTRGVPFVDHVRLADFVMPPTAFAIDPDAQGGAPWVAERLRVPVATLRWMGESTSPYLPNINKQELDKILRFVEADVPRYDAAVQRNDYLKVATGAGVDFDTGAPPAKVSNPTGTPPGGVTPREIEMWEVHARFPTSENNSQDDIICWYHEPTRSIVRGVYQYYHHGKRPYEVVRYFPGDGFYGIGVCEQTEVFQLGESDLFNFTWDNVFLSNSRMVVASAGANIAPGEPYWPGKTIIVDGDVRNSFGIFPMADIYASLPMLAADMAAKRERRNGMGDLQAGQLQSLPSRTPATTTMALMQEGNRRPDPTLKDMRYAGTSTVGLRILQLMQQFCAQPSRGGPDVGGTALLEMAVSMLGEPEGQEVAKKILMPMENVELGLGCAITATSGAKNKETMRQEYLALMQIAGQTSQQLIGYTQVAMQFAGTPVAMMAEHAIGATLELGNRLLEQYDLPNKERIIPDTPPAETAFPAPAQAGGGAVPAGPVGGPSGQPAPAQFDPSVALTVGGVNGAL